MSNPRHLEFTMTQALYRKWRPHRWEQVIGQDHIVHTLRNAVVAQRVAHAYLFAGPRGTGKTTTARLLAKAVNCLDENINARPCDKCDHCQAVNEGRFLDLIEIDAASNTSVDDVRDLRDKINFSPNQGRYKVYIVDEVHMLSTAAFNALLKTLEEPPPHAIFVLATTEIHKIPSTVLSRCQRHEFRRIPIPEIVAHLKEMASAESLQVEDEALTLVARQATGALRDAISLLDQLASTGQTISLELTQTVLGTAASQSVIDVIQAALEQDSAAGLNHLHQALDAGSDPRQFARQIVDHLRNLLLVRMDNAEHIDATSESRAQMESQAQATGVSEILAMIRVFNQAAGEARSAWQPALPLEMAFIEALGVLSPNAGESAEPEPVAEQMPAPAKSARKKPAAAKEPQAVTTVETAPEGDEATDEKPDSQGGLSLVTVNKHWRQILAAVRRSNPNAEALLKSGRVLGVKDGVLYLGFSDVLKSKMEKRENLELVEDVLKRVLEQDVPVRCVISTGKSSSLPPDVDGDGMVAAALRDLGGEIVDMQ